MKHFLFVLCTSLIALTSFSQQYWPHTGVSYPRCGTMTTNCTKWPVVNNGEWNKPATWNGGTVPGNDDIVCIPAGITVVVKGPTYTAESSCQSNPLASPRLQIFLCGTINFEPSGKLFLSCFSFFQVYAGGKIQAANGSSDLIQIGSNVVWGGPNSGNQGDINGPFILSFPFTGAGVLPVAFGYFKAEQKQPFTITLEWSTLEESNNSRFIIERSNDQKTWVEIGSITSTGNSTNVTHYSFIDKSPLGGNNYYRLRQVDLNAQTSFSQVVKIVNVIKKNISIFPNPVNSTTQLFTKEPFKPGQIIQLIDGKGTRLKTINPTGGNRVQLDMNGLAAGLYLVQLIENGRIIESVSLIKQ